MNRSSRTEEAAARWLLRREEPGWSDADQLELDAWTQSAVENKVAYWRLEHGWQKVDRIAALRRAPSSAHQHNPSPRRVWLVTALASIAACVLVGIAGLFSAHFLSQKTYRTDIGGHETVPLGDGSRIELNTATTLRAAIDARARQIWLDRGEAYFEVTHDSARPFVVHAGTRTVTVLGTRFSVRREDERVEVAVLEGRVGVEDTQAGVHSAPAIMTGGDIATAAGAAPLIAHKALQKVNSELSWRLGLLTFDHTPLADVASEFNRYNRKKLLITDPVIAGMQIGGRFAPGNVDAFVRLLREAYGLEIDDDGNRVSISH